LAGARSPDTAAYVKPRPRAGLSYRKPEVSFAKRMGHAGGIPGSPQSDAPQPLDTPQLTSGSATLVATLKFRIGRCSVFFHTFEADILAKTRKCDAIALPASSVICAKYGV
jgi:hypothetical protein